MIMKDIRDYIIIALLVVIGAFITYTRYSYKTHQETVTELSITNLKLTASELSLSMCQQSVEYTKKAIEEKMVEMEEVKKKALEKAKPLENRGMGLLIKKPKSGLNTCTQASDLISEYVEELK